MREHESVRTHVEEIEHWLDRVDSILELDELSQVEYHALRTAFFAIEQNADVAKVQSEQLVSLCGQEVRYD